MTRKNGCGYGDERLATDTSVGTAIGTAVGAGLIVPLGPAAPIFGAVVGGFIGFAAGMARGGDAR